MFVESYTEGAFRHCATLILLMESGIEPALKFFQFEYLDQLPAFPTDQMFDQINQIKQITPDQSENSNICQIKSVAQI
jgi:hypothetical protein